MTRRGASHPSYAIPALLLVAVVLVGVVGSFDGVNPVQAQQLAQSQQNVESLVAEWLGYLTNESVSGMTGLYSSNATLVWGGTVGIFGGGVFSGQANIRLLYSALIENTTLLTAIATPINTTLISSALVNATFGLELSAQRGSGGTYSFDIIVEQEWVSQGGTWRIANETWINNKYAFNAVTSTSTVTMALGPQWVVTPYPQPPGPPSSSSGESCVTDSDFLYCIGGEFVGSGVYYAQLGLDGGVGVWKNTTAYPMPIEDASCVAYTFSSSPDATVLCVGGSYNNPSGATNSTYAARLSPDGGIVGPWVAQPDYPVPISGASCVVDSGVDGFNAVQVVCVGGDAQGGSPTDAVYYASVFNGGTLAWNSTTSYPAPVDSHSCVDSQLYLYCVAGLVNHSFADTVYFAEFSSSGGVNGSWYKTASYPINVTNTQCVTTEGYKDYVFCVGGLVGGGGATGDVFYARLSHTGAGIEGSWMRATSYSGGFDYNSCVETLSTIWCDWAGSVAYDEILSPGASMETSTVAVAVTSTITVTSVSTAGAASGETATPSLLPEVFGLFAIAVVFAVSTVFFAMRRRT